jgi:hypothetical protein
MSLTAAATLLILVKEQKFFRELIAALAFCYVMDIFPFVKAQFQ